MGRLEWMWCFMRHWNDVTHPIHFKCTRKWWQTLPVAGAKTRMSRFQMSWSTGSSCTPWYVFIIIIIIIIFVGIFFPFWGFSLAIISLLVHESEIEKKIAPNVMHFKRKSDAIIPDYLKYNIKMLMKHKLSFLRLAYIQLFKAVFKFWLLSSVGKKFAKNTVTFVWKKKCREIATGREEMKAKTTLVC